MSQEIFDNEQLLKFIQECEIALEEIQERAEYSYTPRKADYYRSGAKSLLHLIKFRLGVIP